MKKYFLFASLVAVLAILASCNNASVDKPKARFSADVDDLTVTITNATTGAESYAWDFGDGTTATDEKPAAHTYADYGKYTITLTAKNAAGSDVAKEEVDLVKKAWEIKIDGNFDDWAGVAAGDLAEAVVDEDATMENLYKIRFCTDATYVYFYAEWNAEEGIVGPMDMMLNVDGSAETGFNCWMWENAGVDILIEGVPEEGYADAGFYKFTGATPDDWGWDPVEVADAIVASEVKVGNGVKAFECAIKRVALGGAAVKNLSAGVYTSDVDWSGETGALPETRLDEEGASVVPPMLTIKLND